MSRVCDDENGILLYTVNLPFRNTKIAEIFSKFISAPVHLANDANCAALGEVVAGGAKGYKSSITLTLGTGVGGGIIIDGKIYTGFNHAAGRDGTYHDPRGRRTVCLRQERLSRSVCVCDGVNPRI